MSTEDKNLMKNLDGEVVDEDEEEKQSPNNVGASPGSP
jgi:hypothetical protein